MNVRKPIDYSAFYRKLEALVMAELPQMELYCKIGKLVSSRPEKGAAVAAAEYLGKAYPDVSGFSPRNLRRMRDFYRAYQDIFHFPVALFQHRQNLWTVFDSWIQVSVIWMIRIIFRHLAFLLFLKFEKIKFQKRRRAAPYRVPQKIGIAAGLTFAGKTGGVAYSIKKSAEKALCVERNWLSRCLMFCTCVLRR